MLYIPTRQDIESLETGDSAYDAFGKLATIVGEIYKAEDTEGKLFVLPTYTALMELQKILVKKGIKKEYWKE